MQQKKQRKQAAFITAVMGAIYSTTVPVGTRLYWSTDSRPVWVSWDGMVSDVDREVQCGRWTKINWTKTAHNTRISTCICGHIGLVPIHTHTRIHRCVDTGWALGLLKASAHGGWEISYPH